MAAMATTASGAVTVNLGAGNNTIVLWDTDAAGDADEAVQLVSTPQMLVQSDDII
jgi:hypothetical protein